MKNKIPSVRVKLILAFIASAVLAVITLILALAATIALQFENFDKLARFFTNNFIVSSFLAFAVFILIMSFYFVLMTRRGIKYLNGITGSIEKVASGDMEVCIPVETSDELGKLAESVNYMIARLKQLNEEERSWEKARYDLVTGISHDLRTPLTSVMGYLELISNIKYRDEESLRHYARIAHDKCIELKQLLDDLFEYTKLNNAEMKLNREKLSLGELITQALSGFLPELSEAGMEYRLTMCEERLYVDADPLLLARMMENLISNAIRYGRDGKLLEIELARNDNKAIIRVVNYGKTIPGQELSRVFDRFYRTGSTGPGQASESSGIGLAIVKSIVNRHGGNIGASSSDNRTAFEIELETA